MRSELFVALSATVSLFPGVESDMRFKIGFLSETLSTEGAQECLFHLHVFVDLCLRLKGSGCVCNTHTLWFLSAEAVK